MPQGDNQTLPAPVIMIMVVLGILLLPWILFSSSPPPVARHSRGLPLSPGLVLLIIFAVMAFMWLSSYSGQIQQGVSSVSNSAKDSDIVIAFIVVFLAMLSIKSLLNLNSAPVAAAKSSLSISPMLLLVIVFVVMGMMWLSSNSDQVHRSVSDASQSDLVPVFVIIFVLVFLIYMKM